MAEHELPKGVAEKLSKVKELKATTEELESLFGRFSPKATKAILSVTELGLKSATRLHKSVLLIGAAFIAIEATLKGIVNVLSTVASMITGTVLGAIKMLTGAVGALYDQFKKLGEQVFNFNLNFNKFLDEQTAAFFKLTQAGREYVSVLDSSIDALRGQGLSISNVSQNMGSLFENTVLFRDATNATRRELTSFVSVLDQAGISADASTRMIQILNMTYLDTGKQTRDATERIIQFARAAGVSGRTAAADFANAATVIAAHGEGMEEVFKGLLTQTRATGLGMNDILGIAGQFDTFEKSAQSVGKLNALLGGPYLNSLDMVYKSEDERVRAVLAAVEASGKSFRSMDRFTRQALAATLNMKDMTKVQELFSKGLIGFDMAAEKAKKAAKDQETLEKAAKQATDMMTNFKNALLGLAISLRPVIDGASKLINGFALMSFEGKQAIGKIGLLAGGVAMLTKFFGPLGLAGSLLLLYDNWENITDNFLGPKGMRILNSYLEKLKGVILKIPSFMKGVVTQIAGIWNKLMQDEEFKNGFNKFLNYMTDSLRYVGNIIKDIFIDAFSSIFMAMKDVKLETPMGTIYIGESFASIATALQSVKGDEVSRADSARDKAAAEYLLAKRSLARAKATSPSMNLGPFKLESRKVINAEARLAEAATALNKASDAFDRVQASTEDINELARDFRKFLATASATAGNKIPTQ